MEPLNEQEALVGVALCAAYADGSMRAEEDERLADALVSCRALRGVDEARLREAMQKADRLLAKDGEAGFLARVAAAIRPDMRPTAFCLGADLVLADGEVATEERAFVERLRAAMGVEERLARSIVDVLRLRNRA